MTNTAWQQSSKTRGPRRYMADGVPDYFAPDPNVLPPEYADDFSRQQQDANIPPLAVQQTPLNDLGGISAYVTPVSPDDYLGAQPPLPTDQAPAAAPAPAPQTAFAPMPGSQRYADAIAQQEQIAAQYPVMQSPKWWQRALAGGVGALAGYSNAASRTRSPINIGAAQDAIEYPGYAQKLQEWQSQMIPAQTKAQLESERFGAQMKGQQLANETQLKQAQSYQAMQHGEYWLKRSEQERNQWKIDPKSGTLYNTINGQVVEKPPDATDRYNIAILLKASPEQALQYSLNGKLTETGAHNPNQYQLYLNANGGDSQKAIAAMNQDKINIAKQRSSGATAEMQGLRMDEMQDRMNRLKNEDIDRVNNTKLTAERSIMDHHRLELSQLYAQNPQPPIAKVDEINAKYANQLQSMQDTYARNLRRRGVDGVEDFDVKPNYATHKIEWTPRTAAPQTPGTAGAPPAPTSAPPPATVVPHPAAPPTVAPVAPPVAAPHPPAPDGGGAPKAVVTPPAGGSPHSGQIKMTAPDGKTVLTFESPEQMEAFIQKYGLVKR